MVQFNGKIVDSEFRRCRPQVQLLAFHPIDYCKQVGVLGLMTALELCVNS